MKRRLLVVTGVVAIVLIVGLAIIGGATGYKTVSVAEALEPEQLGSRVQVSGQVVANSFTIKDDLLEFSLFDPEGSPTDHLTVVYEGGVSATFGNEVTAICTGLLNAQGILECSELVTKCPSRYETATDALSVTQLLDYGSAVVDKTVKVTGTVAPESLGTVEDAERLILLDEATGTELAILFSGAMPDAVVDGSLVVLTGSLDEDGRFAATDIALREE